MAGWSPAAARRMGAAACKLLLPFRVDVPEQAERAGGGGRALRGGLPRGRHGAGARADRVPPARRADRRRPLRRAGRGRRRAGSPALDPGLLKLQHPGIADACRALDEACGPGTPWVLLGGGAEEETLLAPGGARRAGPAPAASSSAARIWSDALVADPAERERVLARARAAAAGAARGHRPGARDAVAVARRLAPGARRRPVSPRRLIVARRLPGRLTMPHAIAFTPADGTGCSRHRRGQRHRSGGRRAARRRRLRGRRARHRGGHGEAGVTPFRCDVARHRRARPAGRRHRGPARPARRVRQRRRHLDPAAARRARPRPPTSGTST